MPMPLIPTQSKRAHGEGHRAAVSRAGRVAHALGEPHGQRTRFGVSDFEVKARGLR
jgi:hypothetical protein